MFITVETVDRANNEDRIVGFTYFPIFISSTSRIPSVTKENVKSFTNILEIFLTIRILSNSSIQSRTRFKKTIYS
jgi:hypothetical protein